MSSSSCYLTKPSKTERRNLPTNSIHLLMTVGGSAVAAHEETDLELAGTTEPQVILAGQLGHSIAGLVHCDAALVATDQLVKVKVNVAVADTAAVSRPPHLRTSPLRSRIRHLASTVRRFFLLCG